MPITMSEAEWLERICMTPSRLLVNRAEWKDVPAGKIVRDIIEQFITPKCYLVIPGDIVDGPLITLETEYQSCDEIFSAIAYCCNYRWHITSDGRIHFGPVEHSHAVSTSP